MSPPALLLLVALLIGHNLGDFTPLATASIRRAKAEGGPLHLIAVHAAVHGVLVGLAALIVVGPAPPVLALAVGLELVTHFGIDATRTRLGLRVPALADMHSNAFWWALGVDQLLHGLVLVGIAFLLLA